jgi:hypothetical protein
MSLQGMVFDTVLTNQTTTLMKQFTIAALLTCAYLLTSSYTHSKDYLKACREKLAPAKGSRLTFTYTETQHAFYHKKQG